MGTETAVLVAALVSAAATSYAAYEATETAKYNEEVGNVSAKAAQNKAAYDEQLHRDRVRQLLSTQKALYGKSGIDLTGSPLLALEDTAAQGELDALAIRYGGSVSAAQARSEGKLKGMEGRAQATQLVGQAGSTLLTGYGRAKQRQLEKGR